MISLFIQQALEDSYMDLMPEPPVELPMLWYSIVHEFLVDIVCEIPKDIRDAEFEKRHGSMNIAA